VGSAASSRDREAVTEHRLCALEDIPNPGSVGFDLTCDDRTVRLMAIRQGGAVYVYENSCPHRRLPLNFKPGQFLDAEKKYILCTNHIALFQIKDGLCVDGPCKGTSLYKFTANVRDNDVIVTL